MAFPLCKRNIEGMSKTWTFQAENVGQSHVSHPSHQGFGRSVNGPRNGRSAARARKGSAAPKETMPLVPTSSNFRSPTYFDSTVPLLRLDCSRDAPSCSRVPPRDAPVGLEVFFAGEHCRNDFPSTVHGAYLSGLQAAKEVAERRGCMNSYEDGHRLRGTWR